MHNSLVLLLHWNARKYYKNILLPLGGRRVCASKLYEREMDKKAKNKEKNKNKDKDNNNNNNK